MQLKTRIIVDSAADLVPEIKERVYTVPLTVHFGQEEYIDGVTIDHKTFYEKLVGSDVLPTTSQATPNDFIGVFETARQAGEAAVVITLASKFSGTYQGEMCIRDRTEAEKETLLADIKELNELDAQMEALYEKLPDCDNMPLYEKALEKADPKVLDEIDTLEQEYDRVCEKHADLWDKVD